MALLSRLKARTWPSLRAHLFEANQEGQAATRPHEADTLIAAKGTQTQGEEQGICGRAWMALGRLFDTGI